MICSLAENLESVIKQLIDQHKYKNVVALASTLGKDIIPRVAANYDCQPIGDITEVIVNSPLDLGLKHFC
jgi:electron transfer flavoprotein alpha subunit